LLNRKFVATFGTQIANGVFVLVIEDLLCRIYFKSLITYMSRFRFPCYLIFCKYKGILYDD